MEKIDKTFLSSKERAELYNHQRVLHDKRSCDRIRIILLLDKGWGYEKISTAFFLDQTTIRRYLAIYRKEGLDALLTLHYSGKPCELTQEQLEKISVYVTENCPSNASEVVDYVKKTFGLKYSLSGITALLKKLGFVYKKSTLIPGKANPLAQKQFLNELEELELELEENDKIFYVDGVHPQHNSKPSYGWFKKGEPALLQANSGRQRININGALNANSLEVFIREDDSINAQSTVNLFKQIEKASTDAKRIIVICDNARYYRSQLVTEYLVTSKIEVKFLPPYSPNLNLIERLWRFLNKKVRDNKYYQKFSEFKAAIMSFFENIPKFFNELKTLLRRNFHIVNL